MLHNAINAQDQVVAFKTTSVHPNSNDGNVDQYRATYTYVTAYL